MQFLNDWISESPTPWHVVENAKNSLKTKGAFELNWAKEWQMLQKNTPYFLSQNGAFIAFVLGNNNLEETGFVVAASHTDSPTFYIKSQPEKIQNHLCLLSSDVYGGAIIPSFVDQELSIAGEIIDENLNTHLFNFKKPLLKLAELPIHLNRNVNQEGLKFNKQTELNLLFGNVNENNFKFLNYLEKETKIKNILNFNALVYPFEKGEFWGLNNEFYSNARLDNLISVFLSLKAFLDIDFQNNQKNIMLILFNNEEIGSQTAEGAKGAFIQDFFKRLFENQHLNKEKEIICKNHSFVLSLDAAHAFHPNYPQYFEPNHYLNINQGLGIKINRNGNYLNNSKILAKIKKVFIQNKMPFQIYENRADLSCGSTVGPILNAALGFSGVDLGAPLWAMHSARETAGVKDCQNLLRFLNIVFK